MARPNSGYQPRNTPAERRAFFDQQRTVTAAIDGVYAEPEPFAGTVAVTIDDSTDRNFVSDRTGTGNVDGAVHMSIRSAGTEIGRITRATSTTAGFLTTSDEDLKENLEPITDDLSLLWMRTLTPYFFNYKGVPDVRHVGYSAQRVAQEWPNGVANGIVMPGHGDIDDRTWDDNGVETTPDDVWQAWMMDHSKITPILHAAIQTMDNIQVDRTAIIADHEDRITVLEDKIAAQADQIDALLGEIEKLRGEVYYTRQMTAFWQYSATLGLPPGGGQMRTNAGLTEMYLHKTDADGYSRATTAQFIIDATTAKRDGVRIRIRGTTGRVFEILSDGVATDSGTYLTMPIKVISGDTSDRGFRVEIVMWSQIWAENPPLYVAPLLT